MIEFLSNNDKRVYSLIRSRLIHGLESPKLREINEILGRTSPRSAVLALMRLEEAGLIRRMEGNKIHLTTISLQSDLSISTVKVPLVGSITAATQSLQNRISQLIFQSLQQLLNLEISIFITSYWRFNE